MNDTKKLQDEIYEYIKDIDYTTTYSVAHHVRFLIMANVIMKNKCKKVFDVGFGNAALPIYLQKLKYSGEYIGTDLNQQFVENAQKLTGLNFNTRFYNKPAYQINERFDCVILGEIITHLAKNEAMRFLKHCKSVLTKDGCIILTTPNKTHDIVNWPEYNKDEYTYQELRELFKKCKLDVKECIGLWSNSKSTFDFIDVVEKEMYQRYEKLVPNSILNVFFNIIYPQKSKHLLFILTKEKGDLK